MNSEPSVSEGARRRVLVTGATSGIGGAITRELLRAGHAVVGIGRHLSRIGTCSPSFAGFELDLSELQQLPSALKELTNAHPDLDGLVCSAGAGRFGSLEEFSYRQIHELIELNLTSQIFVVRAVLPLLKRRRKGDVVFIGSEAGLSGGRYGAVYSATKFALRGLAQALRLECASRDVRVSIVNPGMVRTPFFDPLGFEPGPDPEHSILPEDVARAVCEILAMRRGTVVDEVNLSPLRRVVRNKSTDRSR